MDGTLLNSRRTISRANAAALRQAAARGVHVTICTGRGYDSARVFGLAMGFRPYVVSANGSIGHDPTGRQLFTDPMDPETTRELIRILRKHRLVFHAFTPTGLVAEDPQPWVHSRRWPILWRDLLYPAGLLVRWLSRTLGGPRFVPDVEAHLKEHGPCLKFFCQERLPGTLAAARAELQETALPVELAASGSDNIELTASGVNKATGLARLAQLLGVEQAEVVAVGDHLNDLDMLRWAGMGVAVANAVPEAKEAASRVLEASNDQDGVAEAVRLLLLTQR